ncbi:Amidohydro-rel domain-containing protein [Trichostrongylus colubriformis]|uniref:2-amino-3-carboxymuconate-6-semialdehyde decarboxylase n=1 Tax=Trichostrongylus colubriformis TaxID=6319 RepID=A0AAN8FSS5_TRICO
MARLREMDTAKVNVQCLSTVPVMFSYWAKPEHTEEVSRFVNDDLYSQCQLAPDRLVPLGTLPMNDIPRAIANDVCMEYGRAASAHVNVDLKVAVSPDGGKGFL